MSPFIREREGQKKKGRNRESDRETDRLQRNIHIIENERQTEEERIHT